MSFQIHAVPAAQFAELFNLSDNELAAKSARLVVADVSPGFPCRVSLADAEIGETVLLINHRHQPYPTAYQASHAIYVREGVTTATPAVNEVPASFRRRVLSVRGFDANHEMVDADVVDGMAVEGLIERLFAQPAVSYIHLHNAKQGCYAARVTRCE